MTFMVIVFMLFRVVNVVLELISDMKKLYL